MKIAVLKEVKDRENRIALTPEGCRVLVKEGHEVFIEHNAGLGSGFINREYQQSGAVIIDSAQEIWGRAEMVVKVKEPLASEFQYFRENLIVFTYLHLAAAAELAKNLLSSKVTGIAYETIQLPDQSLPLLKPMSEVAGRIAVQIGAHLLEKTQQGRGILLGGVTNVEPGNVVIIGGGVVGTNSAQMAVGMGAHVTIIDKNPQCLEHLEKYFDHQIQPVLSTPENIAQAVQEADLLIGAVLIVGAKCPRIVTEEMVKAMKPGSVIVDVAIDHGGCIETIDRTTSHTNPTYEKYGVIHYAVPNMPGVVPRTSTLALTKVTLPYIIHLARLGVHKAVQNDPALAKGVNTIQGKCTCAAVAETLGLIYSPLESILPF
jgi:alanine dehydrogenase